MLNTRQSTDETVVDDATVASLAARLRGAVIRPGDSDYDAARRVWNGLIDRHPALIVRCTSTADVIHAVRFARGANLAIAVRGGGHSYPGLSVCDAGLVLDLSRMKGIRVDLIRRTVRAEPGLTLGELIRETEAFGLVTPVGVNSETGVAGLALGGLGYLMGRYGLTCDNLLAVDLVTAEGELITANAEEHPDLFWAVRGGGGNFGVVTSFEFQLHPVGLMLAGIVAHPLARAPEALRFYREYTQACPDELTVYASLLTMPGGQPMMGFSACYCGAQAEGERALAPLRRFGPPVVDFIRPMTYLELILMVDAANPPGRRYYSKAQSLLRLSDEAIDVIVAYSTARTSPYSITGLQHVHGAVCRVDSAATAYPRRYEHYGLHMLAQWEEGPGDEHIGWARQFLEALEAFAEGGVGPTSTTSTMKTIRACEPATEAATRGWPR